MDLEAIAPIIEEIIKETLEQRRYPFGFAKFKGIGNKVASGKLRNSVSVDVRKNTQDSSILLVMMADYAQYVQDGRLSNPKGVPIQSLMEWIRARKLKGRNKKGKFITDKSFAFAIQTNIKKYGIKSSNFKDYALEKLLVDPRITQILFDAGYETLEKGYEDLINSIEGI
jgi:hypothetical protein